MQIDDQRPFGDWFGCSSSIQNSKKWQEIQLKCPKHHADSYLVISYNSMITLIPRTRSFWPKNERFLKKIHNSCKKRNNLGEILICITTRRPRTGPALTEMVPSSTDRCGREAWLSYGTVRQPAEATETVFWNCCLHWLVWYNGIKRTYHGLVGISFSYSRVYRYIPSFATLTRGYIDTPSSIKTISLQAHDISYKYTAMCTYYIHICIS